MAKTKPRLRQDPPNSVQIEFVEGCSLNCRFCGVQGIRDSRGGYKFMSGGTCRAIASSLGVAMQQYRWNPRLGLAMHGEPTMHPDLIGMVTVLGSLKPRELILVTNGTGLVKDPTGVIGALVRAGVTSICLDEYDGCDFASRIRKNYVGPLPVYDYQGTADQKFWINTKGPRIIIKKDVSHLTKPFDKLNTHCGGGGPVPGGTNTALHKRCAKPFRELSIRWDGNVALCCNDFRGIYKVANVQDYHNLDDLWQHPYLEAARQMLYAGDRDFVPCKWCDALSPRVGLLPDKLGKEDMPPVDEDTYSLLDQAIEGDPYTVPVLRGWEQGVDSACLAPHQLVQLGVLKRQPIDKS